MAGYWEGFTQKDIDFYLGNNEEREKKPKREARGRVPRGSPGQVPPIPDEARLCREMKPLMAPAEEDEPEVISGSSQAVCLKVIDGTGYELVEKDPKTVSPEALAVFQARQKVLEQQNNKRKEMLKKALDDRKKRTTEEAMRLKTIQDELHKLDVMLSNDIGILRNQIESASMEFGEAQKRYNKAEKEYQEAKTTLFTKLERKELLTKHLCLIIEQNEVRKAQKLSELMDKLRMDDGRGGDGAKPSDANAVIISPYAESALSGGRDEAALPSGRVNTGYDAQEPAKVETCS